MEATLSNIADKTIQLHAELLQETTYWYSGVKVPINVCKRHYVKISKRDN